MPSYRYLRRAKLIQKCSAYGLSTNGSRKALIRRLTAHSKRSNLWSYKLKQKCKNIFFLISQNKRTSLSIFILIIFVWYIPVIAIIVYFWHTIITCSGWIIHTSIYTFHGLNICILLGVALYSAFVYYKYPVYKIYWTVSDMILWIYFMLSARSFYDPIHFVLPMACILSWMRDFEWYYITVPYCAFDIFPNKFCHLLLQIYFLYDISKGYEHNNELIKFIVISIPFGFMIYCIQHNIIEHYSDKKISFIINLCVMLDYLNISLQICTQHYHSTIFLSYPYVIIALLYTIYYWWSEQHMQHIISSVTGFLFLCIFGYWHLQVLCILMPVLMDGANASWFIYIYNRFLLSCSGRIQWDNSLMYTWQNILNEQLLNWLKQDKHELILKLCCINHVTLSHQHQQVDTLMFLNSNVVSNKQYYDQITWQQTRTYFAQGDNLFHEIKCNIINYYTTDIFIPTYNWGRIWYIPKFVYYYLGIFGGFYCLIKLWNICILPFYIFFNINDDVSIFEYCVIGIYFIVLFIVIYLIYEWTEDERILRYFKICNNKDIQHIKEYYKYIKQDFVNIQRVLENVFGSDVTNVILLYVPDYLQLLYPVHDMSDFLQ
eukprot:112449_1